MSDSQNYTGVFLVTKKEGMLDGQDKPTMKTQLPPAHPQAQMLHLLKSLRSLFFMSLIS